jgi:hypothetical protein
MNRRESPTHMHAESGIFQTMLCVRAQPQHLLLAACVFAGQLRMN